MQLLFAALLALGSHAADAELHAGDPEAAWVRAPSYQWYDSNDFAAAPALARRVYGYLPYWSSIDLATFPWDLVTDVVAFSADLASDGAVSNSHALPGAALTSAAHAHGVKVHLCATLFNSSGGSEIATFLASASARAGAVQKLVAIATAAGIDGLNLDFEFVPSGSRSAFTSFVQELHSALRAAIPLAELTIAIPSTTSYTGYDAAELSSVTERLLLMEYDWHWRTSPVAGANAPLPSVENAVAAFLSVAPASAMAMGVPYYGFDWPTATASAGSSALDAGTTVLFSAESGKFATYGRLWDPGSQTPWYEYAASGQEHQGWVDDGQSLALKYQVVNSKDLAGIMIWALGYDSGRTEAWDAIRTAFVAIPPSPDAGTPDAGNDDAGLQATDPDAGATATDGGSATLPDAQVRGCSQAGAGTLWALFALALFARRRA